MMSILRLDSRAGRLEADLSRSVGLIGDARKSRHSAAQSGLAPSVSVIRSSWRQLKQPRWFLSPGTAF